MTLKLDFDDLAAARTVKRLLSVFGSNSNGMGLLCYAARLF